ncbi:MAG TPA: DUF5132 domain-containing protein [Noviherbaspirillum sp.]
MDIFKSNIVVGLTAGVAATLLAPVLIPVVATATRPLAKSLLKGGVVLYEKGREALAGAGEEIEDLIAEVRSELVAEHHAYAGAAGAQAEEKEEATDQQRARPEAVRHVGNGAQA